MPVEVVVEAAAQAVAEAAVQITGEVAGDAVKRRFGWKGCVAVIVALIGLGVGLYFLLA